MQQQNCKPGSVSSAEADYSIINLFRLSLTGSINLPILMYPVNRKRKRAASIQDLFGLSTPEVYRHPGRPEKP